MTRPLSRTELVLLSIGVLDLLALEGLRPWTSVEIEAYKKKQIADAPPASPLWPIRVVLQFLTGLASLAFLVITVVAFGIAIVTGGIDLLMSLFKGTSMEYVSVLIAIGSVAVLAGIMFGVSLAFGGKRLRSPAVWCEHSLEQYLKSVAGKANIDQVASEAILPSFAKELIRRHNDPSTVSIHTLWQGEVLLDPILLIGSVPVLVWDAVGKIEQPPAR